MTENPETIAGVEDVDCTGQRALVTGSTSGIGRTAALALGRLGADVVVHGRDRAAGEAVVDELDQYGAEARFVRADFTEFGAVRELAATVREETDELDLLVNNAGGLFRNAGRTDAGFETTFHVNHLSPYLLTVDLLDHLADGARVVTTASAAHRGSSLNLDLVEGEQTHSGLTAYGHSKLANVLFASELARRLDVAGRAVTSNSIHPGAIPGTGFSRFLPGPLSGLVSTLSALPGVTSVADGAAEILYAGLSPRTADLTGRHFANQRPKTPASAARDREAARRLWRESAAMVGIEEPLPVDDDGSAATGTPAAGDD